MGRLGVIILVLLSVLPLLATLAMLPFMPDTIVAHWTNGSPDAYSDKLSQLIPASILVLVNCGCMLVYWLGNRKEDTRIKHIAVGSIVIIDIAMVIANALNVA